MSIKHSIIVSLCFLAIATHTSIAEQEEAKEEEPVKKEEPLPEEVTVVQISDTYVIARVLVPKKLDGNPFSRIATSYGFEKTDEKGNKIWVYSDEDSSLSTAKIKNELIEKAVAGDSYRYGYKLSNLQPDFKIKLKFVASYGDKKVTKTLKEVEVHTKPKAPETKALAQLLVLQFENTDAVKYFAKVIKMKDDKETECILEVTMSPCFGNTLGLPGLIPGEKYLLKVWYIKADNTESEIKVQEISANPELTQT